MAAFQFTEKQYNGHFEYHLRGSKEGFISDTFFRKHIIDQKDEDFSIWLHEQGISYLGSMENSLLYSILLDHLMADKLCLLTYFDEAAEIRLIQEDAVAEKIEWRYCIEYTQDLEICQDFSFLSPLEFLTAVNYFNKDLTHRYFYLAEINKANLGKYIRIFHSDVTNWNFIFCDKEQQQEIISRLKNIAERPEKSSILANCEMMISLQIGEDEGYLDYLLLHSKVSLSAQLKKIEASINQFIVNYETLLVGYGEVEAEYKNAWFINNYNLFFEKAMKS